MAVVYEIAAADITDTRVYGRAMTERKAKMKALDVANERSEVMRVEKRDTDYYGEVLQSWTIRPG